MQMHNEAYFIMIIMIEIMKLKSFSAVPSIMGLRLHDELDSTSEHFTLFVRKQVHLLHNANLPTRILNIHREGEGPCPRKVRGTT